MRKKLLYVSIIFFALAVLGVFALPADEPVSATDEPTAENTEATVVCSTELPPLDADEEVVWMNRESGSSDPVNLQMGCPRCDCTLPGTTVPPGQLGVLCKSPIGGPPVTCQNVCCYTSISTPWINGVCG